MQTHIIENPNWAKSASGGAIAAFYSEGIAKKRQNSPILLIGGVHGDEPEGVQLADDLLTWIRSGTVTPTTDWFLIPCLNRDGYGETPRNRTNGRGVDLNRNFPTQDWSSESRGPRYFPGSHANSEPETQAVVQLIQELKPAMILHFHSFEEPCIVFTGVSGMKTADMFSKFTGYPAKPDIGYATPGSLGQYGGIDLGVPVLCLEEREGANLATVGERFFEAFQFYFSNTQRLVSAP